MDANKKLEKKKKIIETAYQLFQSVGVSATAIDDVVKNAGIARGTFYLYFKDKSDLLEQLILYKSTETMKAILRYARAGMRDDDADFMTTVRRTLEMYVDFLEAHRDILAVLHKNIAACMREFPRFYDEEADAMYGDILQKFEREGYTAEDATQKLFIVISMVDSVCSDVILYGRPFPPAEIRAALIDAAVAVIGQKNTNPEGGAPHEDCA